MNEVSIIINGVRYDAVEGERCLDCDLRSLCESMNEYDVHASEWFFPFSTVCSNLASKKIFKKSDKKFER